MKKNLFFALSAKEMEAINGGIAPTKDGQTCTDPRDGWPWYKIKLPFQKDILSI